ncbi:MAG: cytochrome c oxidase assembly protein [Rhodospirillales bacterium]
MDVVYCGPAPIPANLLESWRFDAAAAGLIAALAALHAYGAGRRPRTFAAAIAALALLFMSPLCALAAALFSGRALHHTLLVAAVAPLLAASFPARPGDRRALGAVTAVHALVFWGWHAPALYDAAVHSPYLYWAMQLSLLASGVLMWREILRDGPAGPLILALLATVVQMGMLGALLTFARDPLYAPHFATTAPFGLDARTDQQLAGLVMWVPAALPYLAVALRLVSVRLARCDAAAGSRPG